MYRSISAQSLFSMLAELHYYKMSQENLYRCRINFSVFMTQFLSKLVLFWYRSSSYICTTYLHKTNELSCAAFTWKHVHTYTQSVYFLKSSRNLRGKKNHEWKFLERGDARVWLNQTTGSNRHKNQMRLDIYKSDHRSITHPLDWARRPWKWPVHDI